MIFSSSTFVEIHQWMLALVDRRVDTFPVAILYSPSQRQRVALCRSSSILACDDDNLDLPATRVFGVVVLISSVRSCVGGDGGGASTDCASR